MLKPPIPNAGLAVSGYPRANTVARNLGLGEKEEMAHLIEIIVEDMVDKKCEMYTKKHGLPKEERIQALELKIESLHARIDEHEGKIPPSHRVQL